MEWRKSSFTDNGTCVEVAMDRDEVLVRNSNRLDDGMLAFTRDEMSAFLEGVKAGEFDDLV